MSFTLHTSGSAKATAGANTNTTITANADMLNNWSDEAESMVSNAARYDVVANYASLTTNGKYILRSICDSYVAQKIINYEPEAIGTSGAALRLNLLQTHIQQGLNQITDGKIKTYLSVT